MRMEAKNSYFKRIAQLGNFKNIALTVARRHQKLMCAFLNDQKFLEKDIDMSSICMLITYYNHTDYNITLGEEFRPFSFESLWLKDAILSCMPTITITDNTIVYRYIIIITMIIRITTDMDG